MVYVAILPLRLLGTALVGLLLLTAPARATYSIIALDADTGQVGGAGTSCVGSQSVYAIYGVVPGVGVVAAQAALNEQGRDRAVMLLEQGASAADVIADITGADFDFFVSMRQYAVIDVGSASAAGFTGTATMDYADDVTLSRAGGGRSLHDLEPKVRSTRRLDRARPAQLGSGSCATNDQGNPLYPRRRRGHP